MTLGNVYFSFAMRILHEVGDGIFFVYLYGAIHKHFPKERLGGNTGFVIGITILGSIVGSMIFGPMGENYGYNWPLFVSGIINLATLILIRIFEKEI